MPNNHTPQVLVTPLKPALILGMAQKLPVLLRVQTPDAPPSEKPLGKLVQRIRKAACVKHIQDGDNGLQIADAYSLNTHRRCFPVRVSPKRTCCCVAEKGWWPALRPSPSRNPIGRLAGSPNSWHGHLLSSGRPLQLILAERHRLQGQAIRPSIRWKIRERVSPSLLSLADR